MCEKMLEIIIRGLLLNLNLREISIILSSENKKKKRKSMYEKLKDD